MLARIGLLFSGAESKKEWDEKKGKELHRAKERADQTMFETGALELTEGDLYSTSSDAKYL